MLVFKNKVSRDTIFFTLLAGAYLILGLFHWNHPNFNTAFISSNIFLAAASLHLRLDRG